MAQDHEGETIRRILESHEQLPPGDWDWSHVFPHWLVAEYREHIVGCLQVLPGFPFGYINFLAILPGYESQGIAVYLTRSAEIMLGNSGVDGISYTTSDPVVERATRKYGAFVYGHPTKLMFKKVVRKDAINGQHTETS